MLGESRSGKNPKELFWFDVQGEHELDRYNLLLTKIKSGSSINLGTEIIFKNSPMFYLMFIATIFLFGLSYACNRIPVINVLP